MWFVMIQSLLLPLLGIREKNAPPLVIEMCMFCYILWNYCVYICMCIFAYFLYMMICIQYADYCDVRKCFEWNAALFDIAYPIG